MNKLMIFIGLMLISGCTVTPEYTDRIAREHARFNDRACLKVIELIKRINEQGLEAITIYEYVQKVNENAKRSAYYLECK